MSEFSLGYREVVPDDCHFNTWKEISLSTGGTQSTLQDIKAVERANGYCYRDSSMHQTRNRFIYWRINYDVLELVEHSLDVNLSGNKLRYKFTDTPILDGISIHETNENVIILVPTVCSIHRLIFPHPNIYYQQDEISGFYSNLNTPSIFAKASLVETQNPKTFYLFNNPLTAYQPPNTASSYLSIETGEAFFVLSYPSSELLLIRQMSNGQCIPCELRGESLMPRFLTGIAEKFRPKNNESDVMSTLIHPIEDDIYIITLGRDGHLKFWSCNKCQCISVVNILEESSEFNRDQIHEGILRKAVDCEDGNPLLVVFLNSSRGSQFFILKATITNQQIRVIRLNQLHSPENDLIDVALQVNRIWSVWRGEDGECFVFTASLDPMSAVANNWIPVSLETLPDINSELSSENSSHAHEIYLQYIFHPGRFPLNIINKALSICKRSAILAEANLSPIALKQRVCMAIESEIQNTIPDNASDEEYLECVEWCWQKFYSCCVQYHLASLKPLGLMLLPSVSGAVLLKKMTFSMLRPMEPLEHLFLCNDFLSTDQFMNSCLNCEDVSTIEDLVILFTAIVSVEQHISVVFSKDFEKALGHFESPDKAMTDLLTKIKAELGTEFIKLQTDVSNILNRCGNLYRAIHKVLEFLKPDITLSNPDNDINHSAMHYFISELGTSFIADCLQQQTHVRFAICKNLMLICNLLLNKKESESGDFAALHSVCYPELIIMTQTYYVLLWLGNLPALVNMPKETSLQRLTPIRLNPLYNLNQNSNKCVSLLQLFCMSTGGHEARRYFARIDSNETTLVHWHVSLTFFTRILLHIVWPLKGNTILPEWLLSSGQHIWLQQYVKLLSTNCDWNKCTLNFILGASFLTEGEYYKALDFFMSATDGVYTEPFLREKLLKEVQTPYLDISYYLKVIQLFELHKARDCAIVVANAALNVSDVGNPFIATLYSVKFKHHLALGHYTAAFESLISNPDVERKKDNLRDLVKTLLDEKQFDTLLQFTFGNLDELFTNILLTRARANNSTCNVYYDVLYAYQIKKGPLCHRLAASIMYEQGFRLSHINTVEALEKQVKCYLAAKNLLQLCDKLHAWVVKPNDSDEYSDEITIEPLFGSSEVVQNIELNRRVNVVNIEDIKKDIIFSYAKLKLYKFDFNAPLNVSTSVELVALLTKYGLFKTSLNICSAFNVPYDSVFDTLTKQCIILTEQEETNAWDWLFENDFQEISATRDNAITVVWQMLEEYLKKYEEPNMTVLHKVICKRLISMRMHVPQWLLTSYKMRNARELLRLFHRSGRLDEGFEFVNGYLLAALGYGKEWFGFTQSLVSSAPPFCICVYDIQCFINELEVQNVRDVKKPFSKEVEILKEVFAKYVEAAVRISYEKCHKIPESKDRFSLASV